MRPIMTMRRGMRVAIVALALLAGGQAKADGAILKPAQVPQPHRSALSGRIQVARQQHPSWFQSVRSITDRTARLDARKRGRLAPVSPMLRALGGDALLPMLELIAFDAPARGSLNDTAWRALRAGLIEAVGNLQDPSARPVLVAVLEAERDPVVIRAAASALGALGEDQDASRLLGLARSPGPRRLAVLEGMGDCRRAVAAEGLAGMLHTERDEAAALALVRALGRMGSAWAWKTPRVAAHGAEQSAVRGAAARALIHAFVAWDGRVRIAAADSLLLVNDPATPSLIAAHRASAQPALAADLDRLSVRTSRNPTR